MRSLVLRFSDAEVEGTYRNTVQAHLELIVTKRGTWWGWWKKKHEPFHADLLKLASEFGKARGLRIGLVNRKGEERYYFANCKGCARGDGEPISSPDPSMTPSYYATDHFPAWFLLDSIVEVTASDFQREFGGIPSLDPTLYEVRESNGKLQLIPSRNWDLTPISARGDAILHISDIHFGDGHGFPLSPTEAGYGTDDRPLCDVIADAVGENVNIPIGTVVVSGDLISKGDGGAYANARMFLLRLLNRLEIDKSTCIVVPGNHDLWTVDIEHPTRTYEHEQPYRMFLVSFHGGEEPQDLEKVTNVRTPSGWSLIFISLNSARIRRDNLKDYGYVSRHRYERLLRYVNSSLRQLPATGKTLIFGVLHHHLIPCVSVEIPNGKGPVSLTLDANELIEEFIGAGVGYVLQGISTCRLLDRLLSLVYDQSLDLEPSRNGGRFLFLDQAVAAPRRTGCRPK